MSTTSEKSCLDILSFYLYIYLVKINEKLMKNPKVVLFVRNEKGLKAELACPSS